MNILRGYDEVSLYRKRLLYIYLSFNTRFPCLSYLNIVSEKITLFSNEMENVSIN